MSTVLIVVIVVVAIVVVAALVAAASRRKREQQLGRVQNQALHDDVSHHREQADSARGESGPRIGGRVLATGIDTPEWKQAPA